MIEADPDKEAEAKEEKREQRRGLDKVPVFGMNITVKKTPEGQVRALEAGGKPIEPRTVEAYLHRAFKDQLDDAKSERKLQLDLRSFRFFCSTSVSSLASSWCWLVFSTFQDYLAVLEALVLRRAFTHVDERNGSCDRSVCDTWTIR